MAHVDTCVWRKIYPHLPTHLPMHLPMYLPRATALENAIAYVRCTTEAPDGAYVRSTMYDLGSERAGRGDFCRAKADGMS